MPSPSTTWSESGSPDEADRHQRQAEVIRALQARVSTREGTGRGLHRKQLAGVPGRFEVLGGLPPHARQGLFKEPKTFDAAVRLSNGSMSRQADAVPDIRGFALRVEGLSGPGALGIPTTSQTFALTNQPVLFVKGSAEFIGVVEAVSRSKGALMVHLIRTHGWRGAFARLKRLAQTLGKPFTGFATERFYSGPAIAWGPYAARLRLVPGAGAASPSGKGARPDWAADLAARLAQGDLTYELQAQFYVDEPVTPIEDVSVAWPEDVAPFIPVARLTLARQDLGSPAAQAFARAVEGSKFDPWSALVEHRPLGEMMRARKAAYLASQQGRGAV